MLFKKSVLERIAAGEVTVAFRRWRRPTVRAQGSLKTPVGVLEIDEVERIDEGQITASDVTRAGYGSRDELLDELGARPGAELFRIRFRRAGPDPRIALREMEDMAEREWAVLRQRLLRLDGASRTGPWTRAILEAIDANKGVRAGDLAPMVEQQKGRFKRNVRKLKNLGLTESLGTGYRISPRGAEVLRRLRADGSAR